MQGVNPQLRPLRCPPQVLPEGCSHLGPRSAAGSHAESLWPTGSAVRPLPLPLRACIRAHLDAAELQLDAWRVLCEECSLDPRVVAMLPEILLCGPLSGSTRHDQYCSCMSHLPPATGFVTANLSVAHIGLQQVSLGERTLVMTACTGSRLLKHTPTYFQSPLAHFMQQEVQEAHLV